jgi:hypothetical protein
MDLESIRQQSLKTAITLRYPLNESLPRLDETSITRTVDEIVMRLSCLHASAACAYGFERGRAWSWLEQENAIRRLAPSEFQFLTQATGNPQRFKLQIEGMWGLAWALGLVPQLDFGKACDDAFASLLPNLKQGETSMSLRQRSELRTSEEVVGACDLAYCLHWAIRHAQVAKGTVPGRVQAYVIEERRRALEWLLSDEEWDEVTLDT